MEQQPHKFRSFFSKFAGSLMVKADNDLNITCFTKKQIRTITDNYSTELGKGGFSVVYKGRLDDDRPVAVKKYISTSKKKEFTKEVIIQSQFSHRNIVKLLGCCVEADAPMLVTEFVPNGNLSDLLHGMSAYRAPLSLDRRLQIASDVAEALVYMHTSQSHPILHGDIKPENIFLDNNYVAKLSDFGISRFLSMSSDEYTGYVIGSMGYVDPEFCQTGRLTTKSDVYSFGVVLLELVTRRKAIDENKKFLAKFFSHANTKYTRHEILDREIATTENMEVLDDTVNLALECVKFEVEERPEMRDVSEFLRKIQRIKGEKHRQEVFSSLQQAGCIRFITKGQINEMTDNFKSIPTECFMGKIYKGNYREMPLAVIKTSFEICSKLQEEFFHQMILHSKVNHNNVVKFEGCCLDGEVPILVYEFAKVNMDDILFGDGSKNWTINLEGRLCVAISIAQGLDYLHSHGIIHGDVRTSNMLVSDIPEEGLLDSAQIKVSGIGASMYLAMSKDAHERIKAEENNGYVDPEFCQTGRLTTKSDVYSFGVVLLELVTKRKAIDENKKFLANLFSRANTKYTRHEILDREIATTKNMEVLDDIVNLALECVKLELEERPEMRYVSKCLWKIQRIHGEKYRQEFISSLQQAGCTRFTEGQINEMTDNFRSTPTECFMGKVYKGNYRKMPLAVIKTSFEIHSRLSEEFCHQMILRSKVNHNNVVKFEGYCLDGDVPILVYEFGKVSLHDILFGDGSKNWTINLKGRLCIAISIAQGLDYLHSLGIIHGDVRTSNMLVSNIPEEGFFDFAHIKVSGIGAYMYRSMSKAVHKRIKAEENNGYMDPRFLESGVLVKEADVYSFGVVLLEFFTGKMASNHIKHCRLEELWDKAVCCHLKDTRKMIFQCLDPDVRRRPKLEEAIVVFENNITSIFYDCMDDQYCIGHCDVRRSKLIN